jgi:hypothetical protein
MARKGAEHRYEELKAEITKLVQQFPHLSGRRTGSSAANTRRVSPAAASSGAEAAPRKRRKLSAKARAAISAAQKKRWAKHRAAAAKA